MWKWIVLGLVCVGGVAAVSALLMFRNFSPFMPGRPEMGTPAEGGNEIVNGGLSLEKIGTNWPGFRGPDGSGVSADKKVPMEWSDKKNLRWKTPLPGPGSSSPIVWKDRVFVTCYSGYGDGSEGQPANLVRHLVCVNRDDGKILWNKTIAAVQPEDPYSGYLTQHGYASNTPVTDGERVYVFFGKTGVLAFDFDGKKLWQTSVGTSSANRRWGSASSLVLYGDTVIVNASEESRSIQALDRKTGDVVWKSEARSLELTYGTPLVLTLPHGRQDLVIAVPHEVWGMNPKTGKLIWHAKTDLGGNISPSVVARKDVVYASGGYPGTYTVAVRAGEGDVTRNNVLWSVANASYVPSPVVHGEHLYFVNDQGIALCLDINSGEEVAKQRLPAVKSSGGAARPVYASPVLINGKLMAVTRTAGIFVLEASPKLIRVAHNRFESDDSEFNASPAVSAGRMFIRSNKNLYCVEDASGM